MEKKRQDLSYPYDGTRESQKKLPAESRTFDLRQHVIIKWINIGRIWEKADYCG
jgi:hypothetical protein